ncbi:hypothetical protein GCM10010400_04260 [Streptomyces aculeolatus]
MRDPFRRLAYSPSAELCREAFHGVRADMSADAAAAEKEAAEVVEAAVAEGAAVRIAAALALPRQRWMKPWRP